MVSHPIGGFETDPPYARLQVLIPSSVYRPQYPKIPVKIGSNPIYAQGVFGPQKASETIINPTTILIVRSAVPMFDFIIAFQPFL
jgi:hypothetical protein